MGKALVIIDGQRTRARAAGWVEKAPFGTRITFALSKRTTPQNDRLWALLTALAARVEWHGIRLAPEDWKDMFTAAMRNSRVVPGINGGFVVLGQRTRDMTKAELSDLMTFIEAFAAERGVQLFDEVDA